MCDPLGTTTTEWEHCRLCAQHKSCGDLLDLTADGKTYVEYLELLGFLKIDFIDLSESNPLPKTTCMTCNDSIQEANTFFHNINKAQFTLKKIVSSCFKPDPIGSPIIQITAKSKTDDASDPRTVKLESLSNDDEFGQKKLIYCRFCAEQKYSTELTDLSEYNTLQKYERYLAYFKIDYVDLYLTRLPKTCCALCNSSFEKAYQFFNKVEANQIILNKLYGLKSEILVKIETFDSCELESTALSKAWVTVELADVTKSKINPEQPGEGAQSIAEAAPLAYCADTVDDVKVDNSWTSYPWRCGACETAVPSLAALRAHAKASHGACAATVCADCQQPYGCYAEFIQHVRTHRTELRMFCEYCNEHFESMEACTEHVANHLEGTQSICELCGEILPSLHSLQWHRRLYGGRGLGALRGRDAHGGGGGWEDYPWACAECGSVFSSVSVLRSHSAAAHGCCLAPACADCAHSNRSPNSTPAADYRHFVEHVHAHRPHLRHHCPYCNTSFDSLHDVNQHVVQHITSQQRPCLHCGQIFDNNTLLAQHKKQFGPHNKGKTNNKAKSDTEKKVTKTRRRKTVQQEHLSSSDLTCTVCSKTFKSLPSLKRHEKTHDFSRPRDFICPTCNRAFLTRNTMKDHVKTHSSVKTEICQVCKKEFHTRPKLKAHIVTHSEERPFVCDTCGASFKTRKRLKSHLKCHSSEKPFKCSYCYKDFKFKENLKTHEYQHTGQRPYCCEFCTRTFTNWTNCNKHMVRKHGVTLARTKITPQGRVAIDRRTGEAPRLPCDQSAAAWIDAMLRPIKRGKRNTS